MTPPHSQSHKMDAILPTLVRSPLLQQNLVLHTSSPPPYNGEARCQLCQYAIGEHAPGCTARPQYKCSVCSDCYICEACQEDMTKNWIPEADDWGYGDILPHIPTHHVYKTEAPDPTSPPVLHTSHPPNSKELEQEMTPTERKRSHCFCVFHSGANDHNTPECSEWDELEKAPDQYLKYDICRTVLIRRGCCLGCLMQGHELRECKNRPP